MYFFYQLNETGISTSTIWKLICVCRLVGPAVEAVATLETPFDPHNVMNYR